MMYPILFINLELISPRPCPIRHYFLTIYPWAPGFLQDSRSSKEGFILAFWLRCALLPWQRGWLKIGFGLFKKKIQSLDFFINGPLRIHTFILFLLHITDRNHLKFCYFGQSLTVVPFSLYRFFSAPQ